ncbi:MAG TPA: hypothetical protein VKB39_01590 [Candidatus Baltobacteraceae bacterium]|nr:hypothetical protein [Candidatus Baltobacteraceae bacterium]
MDIADQRMTHYPAGGPTFLLKNILFFQIASAFGCPPFHGAPALIVADATPDFYVEETRLCVDHGIQPYFALPHGFFSTGGGGIAVPIRLT